MKISIVFPSVMYREGPQGVTKLMRGVEDIGFHGIDMFDHVLMGYPTDSRPAPFYSPTMPIMEAFTVLAYAAAVTSRVALGTSVLVLPQRQPTLVAKQVSTLDTLSGGRVRLGVGVGWQRSEYEALGEDFQTRGRRMDDAIRLLHKYWADERIEFDSPHYPIQAMAMEPKPPQGADIPIWIGGTRPAALKRVVELGDGWMGMHAPGDPPLKDKLAMLHRFAEAADRDPASIGMQMALGPGPLDKEARKRFYAEPDLILRRLVEIREQGFDSASIDCVPIFQQGYRSSDALLEHLAAIYDRVSGEL